MAGRVEYEPVSVKTVLAELKDTAELLVDLSFSAVLFGSDDVAKEVLELERRVEELQFQAWMSLLLAARNPDDAEALAPVVGVVGAAELISDAAGDIAKIVLEDVGLPEAMRAALPEATEVLVRRELQSGAALDGRGLGERNLETATGVRVIAVRRASEWILNPDRDTTLQAGDVLLLRGSAAGLAEVVPEVTGTPYEEPPSPTPDIADLERAVDSIVVMKEMSELAVDLAYGSVLFDAPELAEEVVELEAEVDALKSRLEAWTLRAASRVDDPVRLRGLVHLATSTEVISDAALDISDGVRRGLDVHTVVQEAVEESDEVFVRETVAAGAALDGATIGEQALRTETGMRVIAVRRPAESEWIVQPTGDTRIRAGDVLLAKGTRAGGERLHALARDSP